MSEPTEKSIIEAGGILAPLQDLANPFGDPSPPSAISAALGPIQTRIAIEIDARKKAEQIAITLKDTEANNRQLVRTVGELRALLRETRAHANGVIDDLSGLLRAQTNATVQAICNREWPAEDPPF